MLDTNICIYALKNKPEKVLSHVKSNNPEELCVSAITFAELMHGVEKSTYRSINHFALIKILSTISILPFDDNAAIEYGKIQAYLQSKGTPIGAMDTLIAGHARSLDLILVTNNVREFQRVPNLKIENWAE